LPESPDFLVAGDFDADGHWDIVTAQRGSNALYFLKGDGRGGFRAAQRVQLPGNVTALIAGEIDRADGLADLIVAVNTVEGARALVYESPAGAIGASPEVFKLGAPATALALGKFDGNAMNDLAVASGSQLVVIHARDRKLSSDESQRAAVAPAKVTVQKLSFTVQALAAGDFTGAGPAIAALGEDGKVHILEHTLAPGSVAARIANNPHPSMEIARSNNNGKPEIVSGTMTAGLTARLQALRQAAKASASSAEWTERSEIALPSGFAQTTPHLAAGRLTGSIQEDILAEDSGNGKIHVLSTIASKSRISTRGRTVHTDAPPSMKLISSLEAASAPAAVLPMRLNKSGLSGLVVLQAGQAEPTVMPQDTPPANTFTVTNTSDAIIAVGPEVTGPAGSLRAALYNASQATGTSSIVFDIPTTDPGYNAATGTFLIQPLSEAAPGALNDFALNPNNATIILDGYTQPGASPNTLANGDNARILIQIDGGKATTPGGSGLTPFDDVGSVYRGMDFTGWTNPAISSGSSGETASGAEGMEANGVQDFIEGNFFGTDPTGKVAAPNRIGVFADNGPGLGSTAGGNIIGGTTPQARNILSGNDNSGVLFLSIAFEAQLQGNFIGLDATGAAIVSNPQEADRSNTFDGAGLNGPTVTIGGTLPGTANVIAGNGTNVDINDLTNGGAASDSIVQGNLIGTDATGTAGIPNQGYGVSIRNNPTDMLIGGATPAARNVISGNLAGVYVFDNSFDNIVEGNYIGVDVTGTKAVPNIEQGFIAGATTSTMIPAGDTTIGGSVAGAGNVISGNTMDGIQIAGTSLGPNGDDTANQGNFILGNFIGTDATGKTSIPNGGNGVDLISSATNNIIGGSAPGSGNLIANNAGDGVLIDPGTTAGTGSGNNTVANIIQSNVGAGVRINTGNGNRISQNSIFGNGDLGINLQNAGANLNTNCNSSNSGANNLQNAPSLTVGSGTAYITATATDPNGNTSEFSNAVKESLTGSVVDLLGNFNSTPSTTYTIEFFSSTAADPSGYGEGQTYLTSTTVTTGTNCAIAINNPVDTTKADLSVSLTSDTTIFEVGPDFGEYTFTATVANDGPATAHNVVLTDTLPAGLVISNAYCDVGPCQTPASSSLGNCTVSGSKVTCNLGVMAPGATAQATIPVQATAAGSLIDTASVTATETDPNLANNTASITEAVDYNFPFIDHLDPASALTQTSGSLPMTVYGVGFLPTTANRLQRHAGNNHRLSGQPGLHRVRRAALLFRSPGLGSRVVAGYGGHGQRHRDQSRPRPGWRAQRIVVVVVHHCALVQLHRRKPNQLRLRQRRQPRGRRHESSSRGCRSRSQRLLLRMDSHIFRSLGRHSGQRQRNRQPDRGHRHCAQFRRCSQNRQRHRGRTNLPLHPGRQRGLHLRIQPHFRLVYLRRRDGLHPRHLRLLRLFCDALRTLDHGSRKRVLTGRQRHHQLYRRRQYRRAPHRPRHHRRRCFHRYPERAELLLHAQHDIGNYPNRRRHGHHRSHAILAKLRMDSQVQQHFCAIGHLRSLWNRQRHGDLLGSGEHRRATNGNHRHRRCDRQLRLHRKSSFRLYLHLQHHSTLRRSFL